MITISGPNEDLAKVKLSKLPDFEGWDGSDWELVTTENRSRTVTKEDERKALEWETVPLDEHVILTSFHTKWEPEHVGEWAHRFTLKRPTLTVSVREEWDNRDADEPGFTDDTFRAGEWVQAESTMNGSVPTNVVALIEQAEAAVKKWDEAFATFRSGAEVDAAVDMRTVLVRLIKGVGL